MAYRILCIRSPLLYLLDLSSNTKSIQGGCS